MSVEIEASLVCELNGRTFTVRSVDQQLLVDVPDMKTGAELILATRLMPLYDALPRIASAVRRHSALTFELRSEGRKLCAFGPDCGVWWLRILGRPNTYVSPKMAIYTFATLISRSV